MKEKIKHENKHYYQTCREKCTIRVVTLYSFRILLLELIKFHEYFQDINLPHFLNHENAHANMAEIMGATHEGYALVFLKENEGAIGIIAQAIFHHPAEWINDKKKLPDLIRIFNAPNEYGDRTSDSDNKKIAELELALAAYQT